MKVKLVEGVWLERTEGPWSVSSRLLLEVYMLLALTPQRMNAAYIFIYLLFICSWAASNGSLKKKMHLFSSCTGKTWWALCEQTEGDSENDVWSKSKNNFTNHPQKDWEVSIYVHVGDVWYSQNCKNNFKKSRFPATFSRAINTGCSPGVFIFSSFHPDAA